MPAPAAKMAALPFSDLKRDGSGLMDVIAQRDGLDPS
jgi:hypothetical protein